VWN
jgi:rRNA processing protein Gar1